MIIQQRIQQTRRAGFRPEAERLEARSLLSGVADGFLDLAFVAEKYVDFAQFRRDVTRCVEELFRFEPFRTRQGQVRVQSIENSQSLGSRFEGDRLLMVDYGTVEQVVQAAGNPADVTVVLVNESRYGGSGGPAAVSYNGSEMPRVFVHELGHTLAGLMDEYTLYGGNGPIDDQPHANLYAGAQPTAEAWSNLVGATDYAMGGAYPNWWRASPSSIMLNLGTGYFNSVSQVLLNQAIDAHAGRWVDPSKPIAKLMSPANGALVGGAVTITPRVGDNRGVAWVQLWKDGVYWSTAYAAPFTMTWDTSREAEGTHTLQVRAVDVAGNVGESETYSVTVDKTRPTVAITTPLANAGVTGLVNVDVQASDRNGISRVTLSVDGVVIATDATAPYSLPWDSRPVGNQVRKTLVVTAYDRAGLSATTQVVVTSRNIRDVKAPTVRVLAPRANAFVPVAGTLTVQIDARDNVGVKSIWIMLDGVMVHSSDRGPFGTYRIGLAGLKLRRGLHGLQVAAQDQAGNTAWSARIPIRMI
jgi:hypothetical protein